MSESCYGSGGRTFSELGKAESSYRARNAGLEYKHSFGSPCKNRMVDAPGIAPGSSVLQTDADLSQLNVRFEFQNSNLEFHSGGAERTRTVIVFLDREVHTPFCHGPTAILDFRFWILD